MSAPSAVPAAIVSADEARPTPDARAEAARLLELLDSDLDQGAWLLFRRYSNEVNHLVWRLLGPDAEHNDIVQQVFFKAIDRRRTVRDPAQLGSWIRTITVNTVYEELRRRHARRWLLRRMPPPVTSHDLVQEVEARDFLRSALAVIEQLPPKERIVFVLRFVEGKSPEEVADLCRISSGTVKRRLRRADARFQKLVRAFPEIAALSLAHSRSEEP